LYVSLIKIIFSFIITKIPLFLLTKLAIKSDEDAEAEIFDQVFKNEKNKIIEIRKETLKYMRIRHLFFFFFFFILIGFSLYYTSIFCIVYNGSSKNWFTDGFFGMFIDYLIGILIILILSILRILLIRYRNR
jgi:hypothetical protein